MGISDNVLGLPLCPETAEMCICQLEEGHPLPHTCRCGGAWSGYIGGRDFEIWGIPGSNPDFAAEVIDP